MKILFTICGRAGSKGIKNKNIRNFLGKPLPYYTLSVIDLYQKRHEIDIDIVLNTDSEELIGLIEKNPFESVEVIKRSQELCGDDVPKIAVIFDCMEKMQKKKGCLYEMIVDMDITSPLRKEKDVSSLICAHMENGCDVTFSVTDSRRNPYFNMVKETEVGIKKVIESSFTARQQAPAVYDMNASLYAYRPDYLKSRKGVLDGHCGVIKMYDTAILDLDYEDDFELMEVIARYLFETNEDFKEVYENF